LAAGGAGEAVAVESGDIGEHAGDRGGGGEGAAGQGGIGAEALDDDAGGEGSAVGDRADGDGAGRRAWAGHGVEIGAGVAGGADDDDACVGGALHGVGLDVVLEAGCEDGTEAEVEHVHAVGDGFVDGFDDRGVGGGVVIAGGAEDLVNAEPGVRRDALDGGLRAGVAHTGGDHGQGGAVADEVPRRVVDVAVVEQIDIGAGHDHLAIGVVGVEVGASGGPAFRGGESVVLEGGVFDGDAAIDDADLDAAAGVVDADLIPGFGGLVDQHGRVHQHFVGPREDDALDAGQPAQAGRGGLVGLDDQGVGDRVDGGEDLGLARLHAGSELILFRADSGTMARRRGAAQTARQTGADHLPGDGLGVELHDVARRSPLRGGRLGRQQAGAEQKQRNEQAIPGGHGQVHINEIGQETLRVQGAVAGEGALVVLPVARLARAHGHHRGAAPAGAAHARSHALIRRGEEVERAGRGDGG